MYVYPMTREGYLHYSHERVEEEEQRSVKALPEVINASDIRVPERLQHLHHHLLESGAIVPLEDVELSHLSIFSREVLRMIQDCNDLWKEHVPVAAAAVIAERNIFRRAYKPCDHKVSDDSSEV